ncbi:hypothetical protein BT69DRAFT_1287212 [Atractiella rhizophila]|nr:hypothetical protein BT69DRAFT_1287212 [Atractiella rhizophila]
MSQVAPFLSLTAYVSTAAAGLYVSRQTRQSLSLSSPFDERTYGWSFAVGGCLAVSTVLHPMSNIFGAAKFYVPLWSLLALIAGSEWATTQMDPYHEPHANGTYASILAGLLWGAGLRVGMRMMKRPR